MEPPKVRLISGCLLITVATVLCVSLTCLTLDRICIDALDWRIPVHPDGRIVSQSYNFLRPDGMGQTVTIIYIPAPENDVQSWMNRQIGQRGVEATGRDDLAYFYRISRLTVDVGPSEDGTGSQIIFIASCFQ